MQPIVSRDVWDQLPASDRSTVVDEIARILMEELENERIHQNSLHTSESPSRCLFETVGPEAGAPELRRALSTSER